MVLSYYIATQTAEEHLNFFFIIVFFLTVVFLNFFFLKTKCNTFQ